jgi:hypothetical protein
MCRSQPPHAPALVDTSSEIARRPASAGPSHGKIGLRSWLRLTHPRGPGYRGNDDRAACGGPVA